MEGAGTETERCPWREEGRTRDQSTLGDGGHRMSGRERPSMGPDEAEILSIVRTEATPLDLTIRVLRSNSKRVSLKLGSQDL